MGAFSSGLIVVFDATVGSLISKKLKANIPKIEGVNFEISHKLVIIMFIFSCFIGILSINLFK